jgi:hypothetical protein
MRRSALWITACAVAVAACSSASVDPELAGFCERAVAAVRLNYAATHYEGTDQDELRDLMERAADASGELYGGSAPTAIASEWDAIRAYGSGSVSAEEFVEADFRAREYAAAHCDGLSLGSDGSLQLDESY